MSQTAIEIYQDFLDVMGQALVQGDMTTFLAGLYLPHHIVTEAQEILITDDETQRCNAEGFSKAIRSQGVDAYIRIASDARFEGSDLIIGRHTSYMTARGKLVVPKFESGLHLECRAGRWGCTEAHHFTRYVSFPDVLPRGRANV